MGECLIIRSSNGTDTDGANATIDVVLEGYSCYVNDVLVTGTIPLKTLNKVLSHTATLSIDYGYYDTSNTVSILTLSEETVANSSPVDLVDSITGWVNGNNIIGNMPNNGSSKNVNLSVNSIYNIPLGWYGVNNTVSQLLSTQNQTTITPSTNNITICSANKWTTGDLWVIGSSSMIASNIKNGVNIFGIAGTFRGFVDPTWVDASLSYSESTSLSGKVVASKDYTISQIEFLRQSFSWLSIYGWLNLTATTGTIQANVSCNWISSLNQAKSTTVISCYSNGGSMTNSGTSRFRLIDFNSMKFYIYIPEQIPGTFSYGLYKATATATFSKT